MLHFLYIIIKFLVLGRESKTGECNATSYGSLRLWCKYEVREFSPFVRFTCWCTRSRYKHVEIRVVLGCVFNFMMCWKVIYTISTLIAGSRFTGGQ